MTTSEPAEYLVEARGVRVTYRPTARWLRVFIRSAISEPVHALADVDLTLRAGEILGVVGPNGAGKSTLFRVLTGLLTPQHGDVRILGQDVRSGGAAVRREIGFMPPDDRTLFLRQTCMDNLRFRGHLLGMRGSALDSAARRALATVDLGHVEDRAAVALSSGMRFRLMLARAMLGEPRLLVLDEPTGPLDPVAAHDFIGTLQGLVRERGMGAIISSHRMDDIEAMPQRVLLLDRGHVRFDGAVDSLRRSTLRRRLRITTSSPESARTIADAIRVNDPTAQVDTEGPWVEVTSDTAVGTLLDGAGDPADVLDVDQVQQSLREVMAGFIRAGEPA